MIRIALVEDEAEVRAQLQGYVQRHRICCDGVRRRDGAAG